MTGQPLSLRGIHKRFGDTPVLRGIDLDVAAGELVTLLGPSGCGKSTLLRIIAGFEPADAGQVAIGGTVIDDRPPKQRNLAMVFQSYALYPHMTVFQNIAMPLVMQRMSFMERFPGVGRLLPNRRGKAQAIAGQVASVARLLQIDSLLHRKPGQLSGGQRQRVAVGRAIIRQPGVFLMDEPLSSLDAKLRVHMRSELADLNRRLGTTFLYVTHDQIEAMTMSDRVVLMMDGAIRQVGAPADLYRRPADLDVAQFIGHPAINLLPGAVDGSGRLALGGSARPVRVAAAATGAVRVGIRPEALQLGADATAIDHGIVLNAILVRAELLGAEYLVWFRLPALDGAMCVVQTRAVAFDAARHRGELADGVCLTVDPSGLHVFDAGGRRCAIEPQPPAARLSSAGGGRA